jgi:uncharacterized protein (TIGR02996 family)
MSHREARSFLAAICANPDDDTTRLVFADWLDERGDPGRAEFIRTQIERARLPDWDARYVRLLMRERVLLSQHGANWRAELPTIKGITWGEFRRGFVSTASFDNFGLFNSAGPACWASAPVEAVEVRWPRQRNVAAVQALRELTITSSLVGTEDLSRLIESPVLSTLRSLTIRDAALGPDGFRRLVSSPHVRNLRALRVPHNSVGNAAITALASCITLPLLEELDLSEVRSYGRYAEDPIIDVNGIQDLAGWPGLARLHTLSLSGNNIQWRGLRALLQSPHLYGLKHLALRGTALDGDALRAFSRAGQELQLDSLDLGENMLFTDGMRYLAGSPCLRTLKVLTLDRCELNVKDLSKLTEASFFANLRVLNVSSNNFGRGGLTAMLKAKPPELHTLAITGSDLGDAGAAALAKSPASNTLLDVDLSWNHVGEKGARALEASKQVRNLLALRLGENPICKETAEALRNSPLGKRLAVLELPPPGWDDPIPF